MQPPPQEIEAKLAIRDDATLHELRALLSHRTLGGYALRPHAAPEQQVNLYFDTADGRLRARLHGLRIRSVANRHTLTLKGPAQVVGDVHARSEWEQPLERPTLDALPAGRLRDRIEQLSGGAPLQPVVEIHTRRDIVVASRASGRQPLVEIALDDGHVEANGRSLALREVELELLPGGTHADLDALSQLVRERFDLAPESRSKLQRALLLADVPRREERLIAVALALFDAAQGLHRLGAGYRAALVYAASAYGMALAAGASKPRHVAGDALLGATDLPLKRRQRIVAAGIAALQRHKQRWHEEPALWRLAPEARRAVRTLAALLRLADGIAQAPMLRMAFSARAGTACLTLDMLDGAAWQDTLERAAAPWRKRIGPISIETAVVPSEQAVALAVPPHHAIALPPQNVHGSLPAIEHFRRLLRRQAEQLLHNERAVRRSADPEAVHQMRVATRKLRAALRVAAELFEQRPINELQAGLHELALALAPLRDLDVLHDGVTQYRQAYGSHDDAQADELLRAIDAARTQARQALLDALEARNYKRVRRKLARFVTDAGRAIRPPARRDQPFLIRDSARTSINRAYAGLLRFEAFVLDPGVPDEQLHKARIAGKHLRYTLELYAGALGNGVSVLLDALTELQNCLGAMQDSAVASDLIAGLDMGDDAGARRYLAYLAYRRATQQPRLAECWRAVAGGEFGRRLEALLAEL